MGYIEKIFRFVLISLLRSYLIFSILSIIGDSPLSIFTPALLNTLFVYINSLNMSFVTSIRDLYLTTLSEITYKENLIREIEVMKERDQSKNLEILELKQRLSELEFKLNSAHNNPNLDSFWKNVVVNTLTHIVHLLISQTIRYYTSGVIDLSAIQSELHTILAMVKGMTSDDLNAATPTTVTSESIAARHRASSLRSLPTIQGSSGTTNP